MVRPFSLMCVLGLISVACVDGGKEGGGDGDTGLATDGADGATADGEDGSGGTDANDGTDGEDGADGGDGSDGTEPTITATLSGTVSVELFCSDGAGGRSAVTFDDAFDGAFPFGAIWVAATDDSTGATRYFGSDTVSTPTITGDTWTMTVEMPAEGDLRLYATLDRDANRVLASTEPVGVHPDVIRVTDGSTHTDLPIVIVTGAGQRCAGGDDGGSGSDGGSGTGGGTGSTLTISGPVTLDSTYASGDGAAMLLDESGNGPEHSGIFTPSDASGAWAADYSFEAAVDLGQQQLVGVIDSSGNNLFDAMDTWGATVVTPGVNANPITVGYSNLTDMEIEIPLDGGSSPLSLVPYTTITGTVSMNDRSSFDTLTAGSTVYVTALQYRPSTGIAVSTIEADSYDLDQFDWADLTGQSSIAYSLVVPANTVVYLWAYVDEDVDGTVNEAGEAVASGSSEANGRREIGTSSVVEDFGLAYVVE